MVPKLYITRTSDGSDFPLPSYSSRYHVGLNLMAAIGAPIKINPGERLRVPVGFAIGIPNGFCGQIVSVPDLAEAHGVIVSDGPHIVHPADRDPLFVLLQNTAPHQYVLHRRDVIAQLVILPVVQVCWSEIKTGLHAPKTKTDDIILDNGERFEVEIIPEEKNTTFVSSRREKRSIRDRYKTDEDDA